MSCWVDPRLPGQRHELISGPLHQSALVGADERIGAVVAAAQVGYGQGKPVLVQADDAALLGQVRIVRELDGHIAAEARSGRGAEIAARRRGRRFNGGIRRKKGKRSKGRDAGLDCAGLERYEKNDIFEPFPILYPLNHL